MYITKNNYSESLSVNMLFRENDIELDEKVLKTFYVIFMDNLNSVTVCFYYTLEFDIETNILLNVKPRYN